MINCHGLLSATKGGRLKNKKADKQALWQVAGKLGDWGDLSLTKSADVQRFRGKKVGWFCTFKETFCRPGN